KSRGYAAVRELVARSDRRWRERSDTLIWRGSSTGWGKIVAAEMSPSNADLIQRARLCLMLQGAVGTDAKLINALQSEHPHTSLRALRAAGILGAPIDWRAWLACKFAIDIDGNGNAFSNLFTRLLLGCCVIKVASPFGFRQRYYDDLVEWRHYVPVKSDMSD